MSFSPSHRLHSVIPFHHDPPSLVVLSSPSPSLPSVPARSPPSPPCLRTTAPHTDRGDRARGNDHWCVQHHPALHRGAHHAAAAHHVEQVCVSPRHLTPHASHTPHTAHRTTPPAMHTSSPHTPYRGCPPECITSVASLLYASTRVQIDEFKAVSPSPHPPSTLTLMPMPMLTFVFTSMLISTFTPTTRRFARCSARSTARRSCTRLTRTRTTP